MTCYPTLKNGLHVITRLSNSYHDMPRVLIMKTSCNQYKKSSQMQTAAKSSPVRV